MTLSRRRFLAMAGAGTAGLALASCSGSDRRASPVPASGPEVVAAEEARRRAGAAVRELAITAAPLTLALGEGVRVDTWGYGPGVPGSEVRIKAGDVVRARFTNRLPEATTIHWHGISLRNDMDGVPGMTQPVVGPGSTFDYEFTAPDPGTYWFHPHVGLHLDRGLYSPLIVEDPAEPGRYDREYVVVLDDWTDGLGQTPELHLEDLRAGRGPHAAHQAGGGPHSDALNSAGGDVNYALYLLNGRHSEAPVEFAARRGERIRFRIINAGADTPFRVALGGHQMTVTHTDGFPVEPVTVDALMIAMAERYDVTVTVAGDGVYPLVAVAEAKADEAMAVLRSGSGTVPPSSVRPAELNGRLLQRADLVAAEPVRLAPAKPDRTYKVSLGGGDEGYVWTLNGKPHGQNKPLDVRQGERVRLDFENTTTMFHPMHLHGHTFQVVNPGGGPGARKDTAIVRPDEPLSVEFVADNPGQWMIHCHNNYHQEGGMMLTLSYVTDRPLNAQERASGLGLVCDWLAPRVG
ncbi:MAG TPA: multicopper oxidase family protein [Actinomycetes bacterium]|nr:multicopper oxidase family protein [Actinomycetes bacterium]